MRIFKAEQVKVTGKMYLYETGAYTLHPNHTAFKNGMNAMDFKLSQFLASLHSYFKLSTVRRERMSNIMISLEEPISFFFRHVNTRWLVGGKCIDRALEHYESLHELIKEDDAKNTKTKSKNTAPAKTKGGYNFRVLKEFFDAKECNRARLIFGSYLANIHQKFSLKFQTEKPSIFFLPKESLLLVQKVLSITCSKVPVTVDELLELTNIDDLKRFCKDNRREHFDFGYKAKVMNKIPDAITKELKKEFSAAIVADVSHLISHLGFSNKNLQNMQAFDPKFRTANDTKYLMMRIASDIELFDEEELEKLESQIFLYTEAAVSEVPEFNEDHYRLDVDYYPRIWEMLRKKYGEPKEFILLTKTVMSFPHGQADVERSFRYEFLN